MKVRKIRTAELDLGDERFRTSYFFSLDPLIRSIQEVGLVNPPVAAARDGRLLVVAGWKRILACLELSFVSLPVFILEEADDLKAFRLSFMENLAVRSFGLLEKSEVIGKLSGFGEQDKNVIKHDLPLLSVPPTYEYFHFFVKLSRLDPGEKELISEANLSLAALQSFVDLSSEERKALFPLLLPLGQNKQKELIETIQDLRLAKGLSVNVILEMKELGSVLRAGNLTAFQKAEEARRILRKIRYPSLSARQSAFHSAKSRLALPEDIKISPAPYFEDDRMCVEFSFLSKKDYLKKVEALQKAAAQGEFSGLFPASEDD